jgi:hypothetical protein
MAEKLPLHQGQIGYGKHQAAEDRDTFDDGFDEKI